MARICEGCADHCATISPVYTQFGVPDYEKLIFCFYVHMERYRDKHRTHERGLPWQAVKYYERLHSISYAASMIPMLAEYATCISQLANFLLYTVCLFVWFFSVQEVNSRLKKQNKGVFTNTLTHTWTRSSVETRYDCTRVGCYANDCRKSKQICYVSVQSIDK